MIVVIDAPVLDRVFQPVADRLARAGLNIFHVARFFTDGATVLLIGTILLLADDLHRSGTSWSMSVTTVGLLIPLVALMMTYNRLQIARLEQISKPGLLNIGRVSMMPSRLIGLLLLCEHIWGVYRETSWVSFFNLIGYGCWTISCYFASCSLQPPTTQVSHKRSWLRFAFGGT